MATTTASDTFTDTSGTALSSHVPNVGGPWANDSASGTLVISNANRVRVGTGSNALWTCGAEQATTDYDVIAKMTQLTALGAFGVIGRKDPVALTLTFYLARYNGSNTWQLYKSITNSFTQLGSSFTQAPVAGDELCLRMRGDQISMLLNGSVVIGPITDTSITAAGKGGFRINGGSDTTGYHGDDFQILAEDAPVGGGAKNMLMMGVG